MSCAGDSHPGHCLLGRDPRELYQSILWKTRWGERWPDRGGYYQFVDGSGSVGDFAQTTASHPGDTATASQTGTFRFGTVATTVTGEGGGGEDSEACPTSQDWEHCYQNFAAEFSSCESGSGFADTAGPRASGLATVVCFSCGKPGHGATWCPALNEAFPFWLPGWKAEKVGHGYVMISSCVAAERR